MIALSKDCAVRISEGLRSSHAISTMRRPLRLAMRAWLESAAGIEAAPGSVKPSTSATEVMVEAVPITMQWPGERAMPSSTSCSSQLLRLPARNSAQYFQVSVPEPSGSPCQLPRSIGPAGMKMAGRFAEVAPMISAGVVLSQPPINTQASTG